jgi:hypothetical protein
VHATAVLLVSFTALTFLFLALHSPLSSLIFNSHLLYQHTLGAFMKFMNDPDVQQMIHVRGNNLPGLNFYSEKNGNF